MLSSFLSQIDMIILQSRLIPWHYNWAGQPDIMYHTKERLVNMKITDLKIDPASLGGKQWLVEVVPAYAYQDNRRTDTVIGYRYTVALPERNLDKISVRIDGAKRMESPNGYIEVRFENLELYLYWSRGEYQLGARATNIHPVAASTKP